MNIEKKLLDNVVVLAVSGRLDAAWAEHFIGIASETIREGNHRIEVDASGLDYVSSAGIRAFLRIRKDIQAVQGEFGITQASSFLENTLRMSGLDMLLSTSSRSESASPLPVPAASAGATEGGLADMDCTWHCLDAAGRMQACVAGSWGPWQAVHPSELRETSFPVGRLGLGIGAAGCDGNDALSRLGEFIAASGKVVWLPSDDASQPDYLEAAERFVPSLHVAQSIVAEGIFSHMVRFQPRQRGATLGISELVRQVMETLGTEDAVMALIGEVDGLVGASLSKSPGYMGTNDHPGEFPEVQDWLMFCGERVHHRTLALALAFASRTPNPVEAPLLPPIPSCPGQHMHAHAAVLPFRSLPQGALDFESSVKMIFDEVMPLGLMHLIEDGRPVVGLGESAFIRGACWCAPLTWNKECAS